MILLLLDILRHLAMVAHVDRDELHRAHQSIQDLKAGRTGLDGLEPLRQPFQRAKAASEPLEPTQSLEDVRRIQRERQLVFTPKLVPDGFFKKIPLDEVENVHPKFNESAQGVGKAEASDKRISSMVSKDQPSADLKPDPSPTRETVDRAEFNERWRAEQENAKQDALAEKMARLSESARALEHQQKQSFSAGRSPGG